MIAPHGILPAVRSILMHLCIAVVWMLNYDHWFSMWCLWDEIWNIQSVLQPWPCTPWDTW